MHVIVIFSYCVLVFVLGHACNHEGEETIPFLEKWIKGANTGQYNNLLRSLAKDMTGKVFKRIKCFVKGTIVLIFT